MAFFFLCVLGDLKPVACCVRAARRWRCTCRKSRSRAYSGKHGPVGPPGCAAVPWWCGTGWRRRRSRRSHRTGIGRRRNMPASLRWGEHVCSQPSWRCRTAWRSLTCICSSFSRWCRRIQCVASSSCMFFVFLGRTATGTTGAILVLGAFTAGFLEPRVELIACCGEDVFCLP